MSKVHFEVTMDTFDRRIEISKAQLWKFFMDQLHQLIHSQAFAGIGNADLSKVPVRIDIEIPPLDHFQSGFFDQFSEALHIPRYYPSFLEIQSS